jgi:CRP-like cAMP-binding protein
MESLVGVIKEMGTISQEAEIALRDMIKQNSYEKGHILLNAGRVCQKIWFIDQGAARVCYLVDGKEVTDWIGLENDFILSIPSFFTQEPSFKTIELLENSQISWITHPDLEQLYTRFHDLEHMGRMMSNYALMLMSKRMEDFLFKSSLDRYQNLLEQRPDILQRVPLKIIASYLGMTQETLSRMRGKF